MPEIQDIRNVLVYMYVYIGGYEAGVFSWGDIERSLCGDRVHPSQLHQSPGTCACSTSVFPLGGGVKRESIYIHVCENNNEPQLPGCEQAPGLDVNQSLIVQMSGSMFKRFTCFDIGTACIIMYCQD